mgnify:CR=1 FL=1
MKHHEAHDAMHHIFQTIASYIVERERERERDIEREREKDVLLGNNLNVGH